MLDILGRLSVAERASIDECYLDISEEAKRRMAACSGNPPLAINLEQVHICGEVMSFVCCASDECAHVSMAESPSNSKA